MTNHHLVLPPRPPSTPSTGRDLYQPLPRLASQTRQSAAWRTTQTDEDGRRILGKRKQRNFSSVAAFL